MFIYFTSGNLCINKILLTLTKGRKVHLVRIGKKSRRKRMVAYTAVGVMGLERFMKIQEKLRMYY